MSDIMSGNAMLIARSSLRYPDELTFSIMRGMKKNELSAILSTRREAGLIHPPDDLSEAQLERCYCAMTDCLMRQPVHVNNVVCDADAVAARIPTLRAELDLAVLVLLVRLCHCLGIDPCKHLPVHAGLSQLRAHATHPHERRCDTARTKELSSISKKRCREHDEDDSTGKRWSEPSRNALSQLSATTASAAHPLSSSFSRYRVDRSPEPAQSPSASRSILSLTDRPAYSNLGPGYDWEWDADVETHSSSLTATSRRYDFSASEPSQSEYSACESFSTA